MSLFKKKNPILEKLKVNLLSENEMLELLPKLSSSDLYLLTKQTRVTPKVLTQAAKLADEEDLYWLLKHPKFPTRELRKYVETSIGKINKSKLNPEYLIQSFDNFEAIASNVNCPGEILEKLFRRVSDSVDIKIASHPNISNSTFSQIIKSDDIELLKILCLNPSLKNTQLKSILKLNYTILDKYISQNPSLDEQNLSSISKRSSGKPGTSDKKIKTVKNVSLKNKSLLDGLDDLHRLSMDEDLQVRIEVAKNSLLPTKSLKSLIKSETELEVLLTLAENQYLNSHNQIQLEKRLEEFDWPYGYVEPRLEKRYKAAIEQLTDDY